MNMFEKIKTVLINIFEIAPDKIELSSKFVDDLEMDEFVFIVFIAILEDELEIKIPHMTIRDVETINDLVVAINEYC